MPLAAEMAKKHSPEVGMRVAREIAYLVDDPHATFDQILNTDDEVIANRIASHIEDVRGRPLSEEERKRLIKAVRTVKKVTEKVHRGAFNMPAETLQAFERADVDRALVEAGILTEQDIGELRQVYSEISGKKAKTRGKKKAPAGETLELPTEALLEVLSILQALEFADYSKKAKEKALQKLSSAVKELSRKDPTPENLLKLGIYAYALELVREERWEGIGKLRKV
ncbi:hypothetical protein [Palaeococcus ferrophilus]|uniref:hypothetical protein n=1 Tax=Palaeococcus ferrophilus TaxID=83868 RepID=UPI00064F3F85|nr:hypothetical protein [Palaeococcus ferrophilus]